MPADPVLAILVVYYFEEPEAGLLDIHLERIRRHTRMPYRIYAAANRLPDELRTRLLSADDVTVCPIPETELRSSYEHAYYLGALARQAAAEGVDYLCTLDVDSFPVADHWAETLAERLDRRTPLAGILRRENGDRFLIHPSCIFMRADFFRTFQPGFLPGREDVGSLRFRLLRMLMNSEWDTGAGLNDVLWRHRLKWVRLLRSNINQDHYLMAGIYGGLIFHLGSGSRGDKWFRGDEDQIALPPGKRLLLSAAGIMPLGRIPWFRSKLAPIRREIEERRAEIMQLNRESCEIVMNSLIRDPAGYIDYLMDR